MRGPTRRRLEVERLEERCTPAGNVLAFVHHGDLVVQGDALGNEISITSGPVPGAYEVIGLGGTTVNGGAGALLSGVTDDFRIHLNGGNNVLLLFDLIVPDDLRIWTGNGNDVVSLCNVDVFDDLKIHTHGGADEVGFDDLRVVDHSYINTGRGNDDLAIINSLFGGRFHLHLGPDNDDVGVADSTFLKKAYFNGDSGFNVGTNGGGNTFAGGVKIHHLALTSGPVPAPLCPV